MADPAPPNSTVAGRQVQYLSGDPHDRGRSANPRRRHYAAAMLKGRAGRRPITLVTLASALAAAAWLLAVPAPVAPHRPGTDWALAEAYANPMVMTVNGYADGAWSYQPLAFADAHTSIGASLSPDIGGTRLIVVTDGTTTQVLRQLGQALAPQFLGLRIAGDQVVWLEQTAGDDGQGDAALWIGDWRTGDVRELTRDVGQFTFYNAQDDLVIRDGRVYWMASGTGDVQRTEIRSVALTGGPVSVRVMDGSWQQIGGTWLASAVTGGSAVTELMDGATGRRVEVPEPPGALVACARRWCRGVVPGTNTSTRIEVFDSTGKRRATAASGPVTAVLNDVALLDRWEVYGRSTSNDPDLTTLQVLLYDIATARLTLVADGADQITGRDGYLWWSTGGGDYVTWHMLDLHTLVARTSR
jgi:hypothetical protein